MKTAQVPNVHKVPTKQWRRWSDEAKTAFNELYSLGERNQEIFRHPKQPTMLDDHWKTVSWNFAWLAADAVDGATLFCSGGTVLDVDQETGETVRVHKVK